MDYIPIESMKLFLLGPYLELVCIQLEPLPSYSSP